jgi:hypothetical protein
MDSISHNDPDLTQPLLAGHFQHYADISGMARVMVGQQFDSFDSRTQSLSTVHQQYGESMERLETANVVSVCATDSTGIYDLGTVATANPTSMIQIIDSPVLVPWLGVMETSVGFPCSQNQALESRRLNTNRQHPQRISAVYTYQYRRTPRYKILARRGPYATGIVPIHPWSC